MRLKAEYKLRELGDTHILVIDRQGGTTNMNNILSFNDSAALLWKEAVGQDWDEAWLSNKLCENYDDISPEYAAKEVKRIVAIWKQYGLTEESGNENRSPQQCGGMASFD